MTNNFLGFCRIVAVKNINCMILMIYNSRLNWGQHASVWFQLDLVIFEIEVDLRRYFLRGSMKQQSNKTPSKDSTKLRYACGFEFYLFSLVGSFLTFLCDPDSVLLHILKFDSDHEWNIFTKSNFRIMLYFWTLYSLVLFVYNTLVLKLGYQHWYNLH